ncbi:tumor necrosis factor receptor superfamily member 16-like isoform X2 [Actinia tenebrosa]|uniref:Tumor necrosis factor receptor superfamily member 16-like isoform X2 n=1 Tax=Actinia tenebrosa TaxID=6105 RepID=A0A6P8HGH7_ACTTE|nr:tumor necrosis factor receptor superfamily member 16-like isoform X2 [Actinia tenebrosa]
MLAKYGILILAVLILSITVIYATHICGLCPAGFFYKGCLNNSAPFCERCPEGTFKDGLNVIRQCTKCRQCGLNSVIINKCNVTHDTKCRCRDGYYFDKDKSQCIRCSKCIGKNNVVVRKCNGTHNTVCRCKDGYYFDTGALYCSRCKNCKRGHGVVKNCTSTTNTRCQRCVRGITFSNLGSKTEPCRSCKKCGPNEQVDLHCNRKRDTICKAVPENKIKTFILQNKSKWPESFANGTTRRPKTTSIPTELFDATNGIGGPTSSIVGAKQITSKKNRTSNGGFSTVKTISTIVGGILGLALLIFVLYVIWRRNKTATAQSSTTIVKTTPPSYPHHPKETETNRLSRTPLVTGSTELLRNASYSIIEELSSYLNPRGRWKTLAAKLGYTSKDILNFDIEQSKATENMLNDWGHLKDSTVQKLYEVLVAMKWSHEAEIVRKYT